MVTDDSPSCPTVFKYQFKKLVTAAYLRDSLQWKGRKIWPQIQKLYSLVANTIQLNKRTKVPSFSKSKPTMFSYQTNHCTGHSLGLYPFMHSWITFSSPHEFLSEQNKYWIVTYYKLGRFSFAGGFTIIPFLMHCEFQWRFSSACLTSFFLLSFSS